MANIILSLIITLLFFLAIRSLLKSKGACNDCSCDCSIKQQIQKSSNHQHS